jgi:hypothetical protein
VNYSGVEAKTALQKARDVRARFCRLAQGGAEVSGARRNMQKTVHVGEQKQSVDRCSEPCGLTTPCTVLCHPRANAVERERGRFGRQTVIGDINNLRNKCDVFSHF